MTVAKTILEQLGGGAFVRMTGAKNFLGFPKGLVFSLPGGGGFCKNGINRVRIDLNASDTYDVRFYRLRGSKIKEIASYEGVYCDNLAATFRSETGLETRMPKVRGLSA